MAPVEARQVDLCPFVVRPPEVAHCRTVAEPVCENQRPFGELDALVGDGDFGYSLARGFELVLEKWDEFDRTDHTEISDRSTHSGLLDTRPCWPKEEWSWIVQA